MPKLIKQTVINILKKVKFLHLFLLVYRHVIIDYRIYATFYHII